MPEYITKERAMDCVYEAVKATDANAQDLYAIRRKIEKEPGIGWVSVKDRLPNDTKQKIVFHKRGVSFAYFCGDFWWSSIGRRHRLDTVTHWMPLPVPPEEVNGDDSD